MFSERGTQRDESSQNTPSGHNTHTYTQIYMCVCCGQTVYSENFHPSACRVPRTFTHPRTFSENIVNINTTRTDWSQDVPGKFWEKFSEYMFFTPFCLFPRENHWLQRHFTDAVTGGTKTHPHLPLTHPRNSPR